MSQHTYRTLDDCIEQYVLGQIDRETYRKQLQARVAYYKKKHKKPGVIAKLQTVLAQLPIGGIAPDYTGTLVAHCHCWHAVTTIPFTTPCCQTVLFDCEQSNSAVML